MFDLADVLLKQDQGEAAEELAESALDATRDLSPDARSRVIAVSRGADIFEKRGRIERAEQLRQQLPAK
jgi:hypothetical protein